VKHCPKDHEGECSARDERMPWREIYPNTFGREYSWPPPAEAKPDPYDDLPCRWCGRPYKEHADVLLSEPGVNYVTFASCAGLKSGFLKE
jgi:hypothetical protein